MRKAIYPGSFDPPTYGHLDMIKRSAQIVDELNVAVLKNNAKNPLFSVEERVTILEEVTKDIENVTVRSFDGLSVEFAKECGAGFMVRGLRAITDFDYELQMSQTNRILQAGVDTIFLSTSLEYAYLSSTTVKEIAGYHGDISKFVPAPVIDRIYRKLEARKTKENENEG